MRPSPPPRAARRHPLRTPACAGGRRYNSGRIYYLATESQEQLGQLIAELSRKARKARKRAEAQTLFRLVQFKIRTYYESSHFQGLMAALIAAVSARRWGSAAVAGRGRSVAAAATEKDEALQLQPITPSTCDRTCLATETAFDCDCKGNRD